MSDDSKLYVLKFLGRYLKDNKSTRWIYNLLSEA